MMRNVERYLRSRFAPFWRMRVSACSASRMMRLSKRENVVIIRDERAEVMDGALVVVADGWWFGHALVRPRQPVDCESR
jgi:hypothetical protein